MNKKNNGCIYTKQWVVDMMLDLCGYTSENNLSSMTIVEPSCGEGSFVIEIVDRLCKSCKKYQIEPLKMLGCIRAYDIDKDALAMVRKTVTELLGKYQIEQALVNNLLYDWFREEDFIEANIDKADLVIGNPPYIRATDISKELRRAYSKALDTFTMGTDMYIAFMEKGLKTLNESGKLCFICSDRWQKNQSGAKFREFLKNNDLYLSFNCQMHDVEAFDQDVTAYPSISLFQRGMSEKVDITCNSTFDCVSAKKIVDNFSKGICNTDSKSFNYIISNDNQKILDFPTIEEAGISMGIGIATGKDAVFITEDPNVVEEDRLVPLAYARDIKDYHFPAKPIKWLINPWENGNLVKLDEYPKLRNYFYEHEDELKGRHVAKKNPDKWFRTIDKLNTELQRQEKLLIRDMSNMTEPIYEDGHYYPHHNLYWMTSDIWDVEILGGILLSDVVYKMMEQNSVKMRGGVIRNQAQYLRKLRVPQYSSISDEDKVNLKKAFRDRDRTKATKICERLYG